LVVEPELALVLQQSARAWLATRLVVAVPAEVARLEFADAGLVVRGVDGLWRSEFGSVRALLAGVAVDTKIDRLLGARLDPVLEGEAGPTEASAAVTIAGADGRAWSIVALGPCPGHEDRTLVDRGEGWRGCVDSDLIEPWPLPGSDREGAFALVEPRLVPYDLGRVLTIEQTRPERQVLRRYGGDWRLEPDGDPGRAVHVADAEVHSWFRSLHDATVEPHAGERAIDPDVEIVLTSDSTGSMRISCALEDRPGAEVRAWCRRDGGPSLAVRDDIAPAFSAQTFANRELVRFEPHDARAIEILPGRTGVRQGAHLDLGVWKLDAPEHPEPSEAFSDVAIEELLAAVSQLRATRWVDAPDKAALRTIRVDLTPRVDGQSEVTVALHDGCVAVTGGRAAEISDSTCRSLQVDLLHTDPLRFWVDTARELELRLDGHHGRLRRQKDGLEWIEGSDEAAIRAALDRLSGIRVGALEPRREERAAGSLRIIAQSGPAIAIELGSGLRWAAVEGLDWRYGLRSPGAAAE
jgi:hypothetical protein